MEFEYRLEKVQESDCSEIEVLAHNNGGNKRLNLSFVKHWYFNNPSGMFSFWKAMVDESIEGYAATNNFVYSINGKPVNVAMSQNVLTSEKVRGRGLFNKLYYQTESENTEAHAVEAFLTYTNSFSTDIFLKKFGYSRGKCSDLLFYPFHPLLAFAKKNWTEIEQINADAEQKIANIYHFDNAMLKNWNHLKWRYRNYQPGELRIIEVNHKTGIAGFAILKIQKKKGIKMLLLMDLVATTPSAIKTLIASCVQFASAKKFAGLLMYDLHNEPTPKTWYKLRLKNRFNFLVKGLSTEQTHQLSITNFNMFFGDMDIF